MSAVSFLFFVNFFFSIFFKNLKTKFFYLNKIIKIFLFSIISPTGSWERSFLKNNQVNFLFRSHS